MILNETMKVNELESLRQRYDLLVFCMGGISFG